MSHAYTIMHSFNDLRFLSSYYIRKKLEHLNDLIRLY